MTQFNRSRTDAYESAANQAVMAGTQEQQRLLDQQYRYDQLQMQQRLAQLQADAAGGNAATTGAKSRCCKRKCKWTSSTRSVPTSPRKPQQQAMAEFNSSTPVKGSRVFKWRCCNSRWRSEASILMKWWFLGGAVPQMGMPTVNAPNVGAAFPANYDQGNMANWQGQMQQQQMRQQQQQQMWGNIAGMAGAVAMFCERGAKENVAKFDDGLSMIMKFPTYTFNYIGQPHGFIGPMLDEVP